MILPRITLFVISTLFFTFKLTEANKHIDDDDGASNSNPEVVIIFMFLGLLIGAIITQLLSIYGEAIPYTVLVFLIGALFALLANNNSILGDSIDQWSSINAELMLFTFLPPLIFGEAMSLNWYHIKGGFWQATILAGPGVVVGAVAMGCIAKLMCAGWSWNMAMIFGSILSATDPVAVVSLLKQANASPKLTIIIVGESLMNDGTAMVLFTLFFNSLNGMNYDAGQIVAFFLEACIGSVLLGIVFGFATVRWLRSANRPFNSSDVTTQISITICCAYLCFFTAQYVFEISGVLACCGAGCILAWLAPPIILNHETMHNVWGMIEWAMNTLIFLLAGLIIGHRTLVDIVPLDFLYCLVFYFILMALRAAIVFISFPFLRKIGFRCTSQEAIFMSWAGLRGALGMALGMIVEKGSPSDVKDEASKLFFYVGGIATLTLLVNATTAKKLLIVLGLLGNDSSEKNLVINHLKRKVSQRMDKEVENLVVEFGLGPNDLEEIRYSLSKFDQPLDMGSLKDSTAALPGVSFAVRASQSGGHSAINPVAVMGVGSNNSQRNPIYRDSESSASHGNDSPGPGGGGGSSFDQNEGVRTFLSKPETRKEPLNVEDGAHASAVAGHSSRGSNHSQTMIAQLAARYSSSDSMSFRDSSYMSADMLSRALSSHVGPNARLQPELLAAMRGVFLEIVRVQYWKYIEEGKLPRLSHSAQFLLYTVEVGLDYSGEIEEENARDWLCLEADLNYTPFVLRTLQLAEDILPEWLCSLRSSIVSTVAYIQARNEKRAVYMLTSFIEAHEHAQQKLHSFIGSSEQEEVSRMSTMKSPEEVRVLAESQEAVKAASDRLASMNALEVSAIRSKQAARMLLAKEALIVRTMLSEGVITSKHAEDMLSIIGDNTARLEKERNQLYRTQAQNRAKSRKQQKQEERNSLH